MAAVRVDLSEFRAFFQRMERAGSGDLHREIEKFLDAIGFKFLELVQNQFIDERNRNTGYGQLVKSFKKDDSNNIWKYEDGGMTLEVGTSLPYANFANYDHMTLDPNKPETYFFLPNGEMARFVPGYWQENRFIYQPGADAGMVLKYHPVEGVHFWEPAIAAMERIFPAALERNLQRWLDSYFRN